MGYGEYNNQDYNNTPSLQMDITHSGRSGRYPNQFFDLAQQYMPPTVKELFRWCTFYYYNSPLIGGTITKMSRYPITDLIFEDQYESIRTLWKDFFNKDLQIKKTLLEINLDYFVYGNSFVSLHFPFTRFLICSSCGHREQINQAKWTFNTSAFSFYLHCSKCNTNAAAKVKDVPYKNKKRIKVVRWNPENISIKYNEYTGKRIYMYTIPYKLKNAIQRGDRDIVEDLPMIVIDAVKSRRMIRFNEENFRHIKRPTLAEQDQGWGKPLIIHVLKDMFYLYTLRRAQEAIAMEHIVPFDIIYPMPNAQQDPYMHTDLANWRRQIELNIQKHRRDPNYKAVIPVPVGFGRLGGDGKAMLLGPEINLANQQVVGGMGIPSEFLFGTLSWSGSSVTLRMLENDFIQNRTELLEIAEWIHDKTRIWLGMPKLKSMRFSDFRMADDVQRNNQMIGLNASRKISDQTMLTELGFDYEEEQKKLIEESYIQNYVNDLVAKGQAKTQGEAMIIQNRYQKKINELLEGAGLQQMPPGQQPLPQEGGAPLQEGEAQLNQEQNPNEMDDRIYSWANKLSKLNPNDAKKAMVELKAKMPDLGNAVEKRFNEIAINRNKAKDDKPLPEKAMPRREGAV